MVIKKYLLNIFYLPSNLVQFSVRAILVVAWLLVERAACYLSHELASSEKSPETFHSNLNLDDFFQRDSVIGLVETTKQ